MATYHRACTNHPISAKDAAAPMLKRAREGHVLAAISRDDETLPRHLTDDLRLEELTTFLLLSIETQTSTPQ
jgi:hypothetical protein